MSRRFTVDLHLERMSYEIKWVTFTCGVVGHAGRGVAFFVAGAFLTVFAVGVGVYLGADAAADGVANGLVWLRRAAFGLAAAVVLLSAVRSLRPRRRRELVLPSWFNPATAVVLGVVAVAEHESGHAFSVVQRRTPDIGAAP